MAKFYIAYGSNLSVEQMEFRCPDAVVVGRAVLKDWKLAFGRHATIEPCPGAQVPCLIWHISNEDEKMLDRYEGYPRYYYKDELTAHLTDWDGEYAVAAMVYIMTEIQKDGVPSESYYDLIREAYLEFGFDTDILRRALEDSLKDYYGEE